MTFSTTTISTRNSKHYTLRSDMDPNADKEDRKREYNRLAQREFRRRRKEHLKSLEQAQKEQNSEQSEEIERLRYQNDELRRENEALRAQMYGSSSSSHLMSSSIALPSFPSDARQYSLSPSISGTSISGASSPPATLGADMISMAALSMTSSMLPPSINSYADPSALSAQPCSIVHHSGLRHNSQSSPDSSGFVRDSRPRSSMGSSFQSMNIPQSEAQTNQVQRTVSGPASSMLMAPYDRMKARLEILEIFRPLYSDPAATTHSQRHLAVLKSMSDGLPDVLKPSKAQLDTPHYYTIDMIASPTLRDCLISVTSEVARAFVSELGIVGGERGDEVGQVIIWGDDALDENSWELSQPLLERWGWLLGATWLQRANFWRRQRGAPQLPEW
ncbi:uncharacterized protein RCO7_06782 [Rhynchosporium graminicola]|uniref:BZIP domain-containing protein n=1 Tax=Rhynchosporium graminicola TaxID=2792576 RepID=A0A1E1JXR1_9HELO|nr:uncharacterized protein RCO7_06782 [Rhynchosporium commune]